MVILHWLSHQYMEIIIIIIIIIIITIINTFVFFKTKNCSKWQSYHIRKLLHKICISAVAISRKWASRGPMASCIFIMLQTQRHERRTNSQRKTDTHVAEWNWKITKRKWRSVEQVFLGNKLRPFPYHIVQMLSFYTRPQGNIWLRCVYFAHFLTFVMHVGHYLSLRNYSYSSILKILPPKSENFQIKNSDIFHISAQKKHLSENIKIKLITMKNKDEYSWLILLYARVNKNQ